MVQQIKIFKTIETERDQLERDINRWMRKSGARVISITGNIKNWGMYPVTSSVADSSRSCFLCCSK